MFSNSNLKMISSLSMVVVIAVAGCSVKVGEDPPPQKTQEFAGTKCLSEVTPFIAGFIEGTTTDAQVEATWSCFGGALDKFRKYVRGSSEERYSSQELATFLQDNFLDNAAGTKAISPALQKELMKLKQMFVGGSLEYLTMDDLERAGDLMNSFRALALGLNPYMKIFAFNWNPNLSDNTDQETKYFEKANEAIQVFAKDLSTSIQKNHLGYNLNDLVMLIKEMSALSDNPWPSVASLEKYMPVVLKIKKAISGGAEEVVAPNEWRSFLLLSARSYVQFLRYHYFISVSKVQQRTTRLEHIARTAEDSFSIFQDLVQEKPSGIVTRAEINALAETLAKAWTSFKTSDKLILEIMKVKKLIIGGSLDAFTVADFATAGLKVSRLKELIATSQPYFKVYISEWKPDILSSEDAQVFFRKAQLSLSSMFAELGALLEGDYDLESLNSLMRELISLYPSINDGRETDLEKLFKKYIPVVIAAKNMSFNDQSSAVKKIQWTGFLRSVATGYSLYLYSDYFMQKLNLQTATGLTYLGSLVDQTVVLLREMMELNTSKRFRLESINSLGKRLVRADLLPGKIDDEVWRSVTNAAVNRALLAPDLRLRGKYPSALNPASLEILRFEFKIWLEQELFFVKLFRKTSSYSQASMRKEFSDKYKVRGLSKELNTGLYEMIVSLDSSVPMTVTSKGYLLISGIQSQRYDQGTLTQLNLNRTLARLLARSYANDLTRITKYQGIILSEAERAFQELRAVAIKVGGVDPKNINFASSRFREANIFVPDASGDDYASFRELAQLVGMIWSGAKLNKALGNELRKDCLGGNSYSDDTKVGVNCVVNSYDKQMRSHLRSSLPEHVKYMNAIGFDVWNRYLSSVLRSAGYTPNSSGKASMRDISLAPHVIQYIEMMFMKFDRNNDHFLDTQEALSAFPTFRSLIKTFAGGVVQDKDLDSVFTYILKYGKPPETTYEKMQFVLKWKGKPYNWDIRAERTQISKILGYIADQTSLATLIGEGGNNASHR